MPVAAQRSSIAALHAQLTAFGDQLAALEGILGPLAGRWSSGCGPDGPSLRCAGGLQ